MKKRLKIDPASNAKESVFEDGNLDFNPSIRIEESNYFELMFFNLGKKDELELEPRVVTNR